jgi:hypothetical protein
MSDRCAWVVFQFAGKDIDVVRKLIDLPEDEDTAWGDYCYVNAFGVGEVSMEDVDYGGEDYLGKLIDAGIPFEGSHADGVNYGSMCFAFIGDNEDSSSCYVRGVDGVPIAEIHENLKPAEKVLDEISRYYRIRDKVREYIEMNKGNPTSEKEKEEENGEE